MTYDLHDQRGSTVKQTSRGTPQGPFALDPKPESATLAILKWLKAS